jgi:hypothetical protein
MTTASDRKERKKMARMMEKELYERFVTVINISNLQLSGTRDLELLKHVVEDFIAGSIDPFNILSDDDLLRIAVQALRRNGKNNEQINTMLQSEITRQRE